MASSRLLRVLPALLLGASLVQAASACSRDKAAPSPGAAPSAAIKHEEVKAAAARPLAESVQSVLFITVDALRADQPWTGYRGVQTPALSRLAAESVVYTRAYSLANTTAASLGGMLGGRYPSEIARDACILASYDLSGGLAPLLQKAGVRTFAAHGHALFVGNTAPRVGFDDWRLIKGAAWRLQSDGAITSDDIAELVIDYVSKADGAARHFMWAHFVDPHDGYAPHADFPAAGPGARPLYDGEVAHTDRAIGRVLDSLRKSPLSGRTAIVVTADHGEAFGEHATARHGFTVYDEEVRVPLIVHIPGVSPRVLREPRSAIDLAPTVAELLAQPPSPRWRGVSLLRDLEHSAPPRRFVLVDAPEMVGRTAAQAVVHDNLKVIFDNAGARSFDLQSDPSERAPLGPEQNPEAIAEARRQLAQLVPVPPDRCRASAPPAKVRKAL